MTVKLLIMLLLLVLASSQSSNNITPPPTIQIQIQFGHNTYSPIEKYFSSQQKVQITDMISDRDNKTYHFCYIQALLNSDLIQQDCLKLFNTTKDNNGQKSTTAASPILYKLNDIIEGESVLGTYYYQTPSDIKSGDKKGQINTKYVLVVKSKGLEGIRLDDKCLKEQQSKQQQNNATKCENTQSVIQLSLQQQVSKAKFIELNGYNNKTSSKQILLLTQSHIYSVQLFTGNQGLQSNIIIETLAKLDKNLQQETQQEFTTFIIDQKDNLSNDNEQTTAINLLLFTNKKNAHLYKLSASTNQRVKLQSESVSSVDTEVGTQSENKDLQLVTIGDSFEGEVVYYNKGNKENKILLVAGKSVSNVHISADARAIFGKYDHNASTNKNINNTNTIINTDKPLFYQLPNTHRCHKIHQYQHQYVFLQCKNHLLYFKVKDLMVCFNNQDSGSNITQECLNAVKQSHLNLGFHIQSTHFPTSNPQSPYLTVTTLDKYSHFYIDYSQQQIHSINNVATYYYSNQTLKKVYRTNGGKAIVLTKGNAVMVKQEEEGKEIYCKTVDENSRRELGQPVGRFTGQVVVQGVCKHALFNNNDKLPLQNIENSTLCRYKVPTVVTITHTANKYKSIWQVLLATGLTTTILSIIFCLVKSRKLKQIYNVLEEEKYHGNKVMQGTVITQVNQSQEESMGAGIEPLGK